LEYWSIAKYQIPILNDQNRFGILKLGFRPQGGESKRSADNFGHCDLEFLVTSADFPMKERRQMPPLEVVQSRVLKARLFYCLWAVIVD
jgi:hypothetical protein